MKRKEPAEHMQLVSPKNNDYAEDINVSKLLCKCDANIFIELLKQSFLHFPFSQNTSVSRVSSGSDALQNMSPV